MKKVLLITNMPTHHQVELFDEISSIGINLKVIYTRELSAGRNWIIEPDKFRHTHQILKETRIKNHWYFNHELLLVFNEVKNTDILVVGQYASITMQFAMYLSYFLDKKLIFWSEPIEGVKYEERKLIKSESISGFARKIALIPVKNFAINLWGIGKKGVGTMINLNAKGTVKQFDYYSDLSKFYKKDRLRIKMDDNIRFVYCGSLSKRKGVDIIIEAIHILKKNKVENFSIDFIGGGEYLKSLQNLEMDNIIIHDFVQQNEVSNFYNKGDILLFPSRYDGWGMSLVEGMACGLPVISSKEVGSAVDLIDRATGFFIEDFSGDSLARVMSSIIEDKRIVENMSANCREKAKKYDVKFGANLFKCLIDKIK